MNRLFEYCIEVIGWIRIVASPLMIGLILGGIIYFNKQDEVGFAIAISVSFLGLTIGVIWASRVWKRQGTHHFLSGIDATQELDKKRPKKV